MMDKLKTFWLRRLAGLFRLLEKNERYLACMQRLSDLGEKKEREWCLNYAEDCIYSARYREAAELMEDMLPKFISPELLRALGYCCWRLGDTVKSIRYYRTALEIEPLDYDTRLNLAAVYAQVGESREALILLKDLLKDNPCDYQLLNNLAWVYEGLREYTSAESFYYRSLAVSGCAPDIAYNLVCCLKNGHNLLEALEISEYLKVSDVWKGRGFSQLAQIYEEMGAEILAVEYYNKAYGLEAC
jgi:tetratricopeptide (TPR) repeat protein